MLTSNTIPFALPGFNVAEVEEDEMSLIIHAYATEWTSRCPDCSEVSSRIHSYYTRIPRDLPCCGKVVRLVLHVRRFRCLNGNCRRKTFVERLPGVVPVYAQRTIRLTALLKTIAFEVGGQVGARILRHIRVALSGDTLLRIIRREPESSSETPRVLGGDDWAYTRGHIYGTILIDMEKHCPIDLLPDRDDDTFAAWLRVHPGVEVICRDRASDYATGATVGSPGAIQIADRWHLFKNLGEALQRMLEKRTKYLLIATQQIHNLVAEAEKTIQHDPLRVAEPLEPRQSSLFEQVKALAREGKSQRAIARQLHIHRQTVARYICLDEPLARSPTPQTTSTVTPYLPYITQRWQDGCHNAMQLWYEIREQGYHGSYSSVRRIMSHRFWKGNGRRFHRATDTPRPRPPSPRQVMWWLVRDDDQLKPDQIRYREVLLEICPEIALAHHLAWQFLTLFRERQVDAFDQWLADAEKSHISALRHFAVRLRQDYDAVKNALIYEWSSGQVEGQVNRLKVIKRQMYGRANFDLLRLRVLYSAP